jgi:diguanylate cyclase (GGDEF)-like protein
VGDNLLQQVALRLSRCVRESDTVARVGGDEFVVLLPKVKGPAQVERVAAKIRRDLSRPFSLDGHNLLIVPSIGTAYYPQHGQSAEQLLKHADQAMYMEKKKLVQVVAASSA